MKENIAFKLEIDYIERLSADMYKLMEELFPLCRSITGKGVRDTLEIIGKHIPIQVEEVPSGTQAFDWTVPKEWNIKDAYIRDSKGEKIVDFNSSNLHVVNYSIPVDRKMTLEELKPYIHTLPEHPDWIPYVTSYYKDSWGFCMTHNQYMNLQEDEYEVLIDSSLENGSLTYGELCLKGEKEDEILLTCYICHPSMCNDNLSGTVLLTFLAKELMRLDLIYSYRFLFIPETIGAITWLSNNEKKVSNIKSGLVATCVGDSGALTYKRSRKGDSLIDKAVERVLKESGAEYKIMDFFPYGSDERQFSSPGFALDIGSLMRTPYGCYNEYHTSADNLGFISPNHLYDSLLKYRQVIEIIENNRTFLNMNPKCEPQLGRQGIYEQLGGQYGTEKDIKHAILWVLNLSDGSNSLLDIATRSGMGFRSIRSASDVLAAAGLVTEMKLEGLD